MDYQVKQRMDSTLVRPDPLGEDGLPGGRFGEATADAALDASAVSEIHELNPAEASNLSFILSHRFARNESWRLTDGIALGEGDKMAELASKVSRRLEELSLRLAEEKTRAELGGER